MEGLPFVETLLDPMDPSIVWIVVVGFVVAFVLAFGLGANDAANSFGTAVGARVFTLLQAIILASIFETLGAILLGGNVSGTIRGGLFDANVYAGHEQLLMVGQLSALSSACVWLLIATILSIPVSASHSIVGASLGFHLVLFLGVGVDWFVIGKIAISWVVSPLLSGIVSAAIYYVLKYTLLDREDQLKWGLRALPIWYFIVFFINSISILLSIKQVATATVLGVWLVVLVALGVALFIALGTFVFLVPYTKRKAIAAGAQHREEKHKQGNQQTIQDKAGDVELAKVNNVYDKKVSTADEGAASGTSDAGVTSSASSVARPNGDDDDAGAPPSEAHDTDFPKSEVRNYRADSFLSTGMSRADDEEGIFFVDKQSEDWLAVKDTATVTAICGPLQGLSACFAAFSHGGNDVSNAIGPLIGLYLIYQEGRIVTDEPTPIWILLYGGAGIAVGLAILGRRVIKTIGTDLTPMTPSTGFAINLGAATTVLIASNLGIPVSTTHCLVGSVCVVGLLRARKAMDWGLFTGIFTAWIITLPVTVLMSAAFMGLLQHAVPGGCEIQQMQYPGPNTTYANASFAPTMSY